MDTLFVEKDQRLQRLRLNCSTGQSIEIHIPEDLDAAWHDERLWSHTLGRVRDRLNLPADGWIQIVTAEPFLQAIPWELLAAPGWDLGIIRSNHQPVQPGSVHPPCPLRILLALPETSSAPLRAALDGLQRRGDISLTNLQDLTLLGNYLGRAGYYHVLHIPSDAPCLASVQSLRRRCSQVSWLTVHARSDPPPLPTLATGEIPAVLVLGSRLGAAQTGRFLARLYAALLVNTPLAQAFVAAQRDLDPEARRDAILLTDHPQGDVWPQSAQPRAVSPSPAPAAVAVRPSTPAAPPATGLFVGGNIAVDGDMVVGTLTKTVKQVGGDMVEINRRAATTRLPSPTPHYCSNCGAELAPGGKFCPQCGHPCQI